MHLKYDPMDCVENKTKKYKEWELYCNFLIVVYNGGEKNSIMSLVA
jgi:hypothetical protein